MTYSYYIVGYMHKKLTLYKHIDKRVMLPGECSNLKVGDFVLCFQERRDQAIYYDVHIVKIQRRMHDIRGCRCHILIR